MKFDSKYILRGMAVCFMAAAFAACSDDKNDGPSGNGGNDDPNAKTVGIKTNITVNTKAALTTDFAEGNKMNIWAKEYNSVESADIQTGISATLKGNNWEISPAIRLSQGKIAFLYAAAPYDANATDLTKFPVDITTQTDYLYSGSYVAASFQNNVATLNMKHALSMLSINIAKQGYSGNGNVTALKITDSNNILVTKGTMNVSTGKITGTEHGTITANVSATATDHGIQGQLPSMWVAPFSNKGVDLVLTVTIDGKEYNATLPEVTMNIGWQYVFQAVLTPNGLAIIPDATEEYSLNRTDDEMAQLNGYGAITFSVKGSTFNFPAFEGNEVFGNVAYGNKSTNYSIGGSIELGGATSVTVETWNSTGFTISNFENIDEIDLTNY